MELGIASKRLTIISVLFAVVAVVSFVVYVLAVNSNIIPLSSWVILEFSSFWVKINSITAFRINTVAGISLMVIVFASWFAILTLGPFSAIIRKLNKTGGYETLGDAKKRIKSIIVSGSKIEKAVIYSSIIIFLAAYIYLMTFFLSTIGLVPPVPNIIIYVILLLLASQFFIRRVIK